jgi:hypothetical protein
MSTRTIIQMELSRRCLLRGAACAAGAATIIGVTAEQAVAGKMSQSSVSYRASPKGNQRCDNCALFQGPSACKSVDGSISPQGWCSIWVPKRG